jgi:hypothetical protein
MVSACVIDWWGRCEDIDRWDKDWDKLVSHLSTTWQLLYRTWFYGGHVQDQGIYSSHTEGLWKQWLRLQTQSWAMDLQSTQVEPHSKKEIELLPQSLLLLHVLLPSTRSLHKNISILAQIINSKNIYTYTLH